MHIEISNRNTPKDNAEGKKNNPVKTNLADENKWNPSDIWAVKRSSESKLKSEVDKLYKAVSKDNDIEKLNDFIFKKFKF